MSRNISSNVLRFAGDINVEKVIISSLISGRSLNVTNQLATIQIYEDLFSHFITGSLIFQESLDLANYFPFVGEEVVDIKLYTPTINALGNGGVIEGQFYIYKMSDRSELAERSLVYQLHFISLEAITDLNTKISKAYSGKISDTVKRILLDDDALATKKKIFIEETSNNYKHVSNYWSPVRNLTHLMDNAENSHGSPTYIFFENRDGLNFVSLDKLNSGAVKQEFIYNNSQSIIDALGGSSRDIDSDYKRITELEVPVNYDFMNKVLSGSYGSTMIYNDIVTKKYFKKEYSSFIDWNTNKETHINKYPMASTNVINTFEAKIFNDIIARGTFNDYGDTSNVSSVQIRQSRLLLSEAFKLRIVVPGRTDYTVGQIVSVLAFQSKPIDETDEIDTYIDNIISGNYLISAINHVIDRENHLCNMELIKDSYIVNLGGGGK